ncbi:ABC transporter substrate-binding protein [Pontibacterium sp.]|uniref:ABC transporter substrate-binding protein n=1 Tax=Pontibacterium sp. TaxID=2036026 RepID=UPI003510DAC6
MLKRLKNPLKLACSALLLSSSAALAAKQPLTIDIAYLQYQPERPPALSNVLPEPEDAGLNGAELGIKDSNTTGRFLKQKYQLTSKLSDDPEQIVAEARVLYDNGQRLFVANMPSAQLQQLAEALGADALIFNAGSQADELRTEVCLNNVLHTTPSRSMLTDALGQWLNAKRLKEWLLISGNQPEDKAYAAALKRTAKRFGAEIVEEKAWSFDTDLRRTAQGELPLFTQTDEYDVVVVADERGDFGEYLLYNTWYPRPIAGTQGLVPVTWHRVVEQWGAAQLQSRFDKLANRWMTGKDYAAWAGVRSIAEAVTQTKTNDATALRSYILSDKFQLAAFKGRKLNYRDWSGQLRQPIPLIHPRALVSQSPQQGFLHPVTDLDTLGFDKPESRCRMQ